MVFGSNARARRSTHESVEARAAEIFQADLRNHRCQVDRLLVKLLVFQWVVGVVAALALTPYTWAGSTYEVHFHVKVVLLLGGLITLFPCFLASRHPGAVLTRHVIGWAQMSFSAILIHLFGGRIETHFHVFGSLAFLAFYLDWRVMVTSTLLVAADHLLRGMYFPLSVYGVELAEPWRWLEHSSWAIFEDVFLVIACLRGEGLLDELAHRQAREEYEAASLSGIMESLPSALLVLDEQCTILLHNSALGEVSQVPSMAGRGRKLREVLEEDVAEELHRCIRGEEGFYKKLHRPGRRLLALSGKVMILNPGSSDPMRGWVVLLEDVTHLREVEDMKTDFVATVSHELRTPFTAILGFAKINHSKFTEILEPHIPKGDPKVAKAARQVSGNQEIVIKEGERLLKLINNLLDVLRLESRETALNKEPVQIQELIDSSIQSVESLVDQNRVTLRTLSGSQLPEVSVDSQRITQVLVNLLSNAIKFTEKGSITCQATLLEGQLSVEVADTGLGIPDKEKERIFQKFTQVGDVMVSKPEGSGLGLAICKEIVEQHHGTLWVRSQMGKGSTFGFTIPVRSTTL